MDWIFVDLCVSEKNDELKQIQFGKSDQYKYFHYVYLHILRMYVHTKYVY